MRRRGNLWARLERLETGTGDPSFAFRLTDGRTARVPVEAVLDAFTGTPLGDGPHGAVIARIAGTPDRAALARSLVDMARTHRGETP